MCFGIPMEIKEINGLNARCEAKGVERMVSLIMLEENSVKVGDKVVVSTNYAINKISDEDAKAAWAIYDEMLAQNI
jgi:hydrogenase expression/formation protein HypC